MSFQSQPLPNGQLPSATPLDSFNKFQPPTITGQYQPPMTQQMFQTKLPPPQQQQQQQQQLTNQALQQLNPQYPQQQALQNRQQQQLLANGGSNTSSRNASPAFNQSINSVHLPPTQGSTQSFVPWQASSQNQQLFPSRQPPSLHGSNQNLSGQNSVNPNVANLTTSMKNVSITNGQPPISNATNHNPSPSLVNGNQNQIPRMQANINSTMQANGPQLQPVMAPFSAQNQQIPGPQYQQQQHLNGQMPQQVLQQQRQQQHTTMPQFNNHLPANQPTSASNNMQTQRQPLTSQSHFPNQIQPPGPSLNQSQYPNQFQNNNVPNAVATLPPSSVAGPPSLSTTTAFNKRPMYPPQVSTQPLQQQQQQYQQLQTTQNNYPSQQSQLFTGQPNNTPIQYQNNKQMNFPTNPMGVTQQGFNKMWGHETVDLMQQRHILPTSKIIPPNIELGHEFYESVNCSSEILRCTLTKIPESNSLLQKSRLPLGILIHPFKDLNNLPVIQCSTIVRCRSCRTYINPFVSFVDSKKWRCNLCYRVNELPEEFQYDPVSKSYGDVTRRPEVKSSTIEFIAPSEYMLRPPQPAIYLFLLDVSQIAQQSGYLDVVCQQLSEHLDDLPGDARAKVGFIAYNSAVHFYSIADGFNQPHEITVVDIEDPFLPCPDNLLINLNECKELIKDLLCQLPKRFANSYDSNSALGAALQIAFKLMHQPGGRVTVFQACLPNVGPGALKPRENPNDRSAKEIQHLGPATDFYKRLALECSGQQIAVDVFLLNSQYSDLATISGISKFSGGCLHHFPLFNSTKLQQVEQFRRCLDRYLTRKIGFESVMRVRCTRGLAIHTFHGNFFVRSTDLLSLPNVNPDAGFGMQISYEESLTDTKTVCFQAALLYTSSKGERRIRVHTLCLPVTSSLSDVMHSADCQAIIGLISKMAVDRSLQTSISDARDAFINASVDVFSAFRIAQNLPSGAQGQLIAPTNLSLLPLYMLALLKHIAFRTGTSTRLDDRVFAMCELKTLPLDQLIRNIYPDFYHLDNLFYQATDDNDDNKYDPPLLQLSAEKLDSRSVFLLDTGLQILILVGTNVPPSILKNVFGLSTINEIPDQCYDLPSTGTPENEALHTFIETISVDKPYTATIQIIRDTSPSRTAFTEKLVDDRSESSLSYYEFLQHLRAQVK